MTAALRALCLAPLAALLLALWPGVAPGHDAHDWIRIGDYRDWMGQKCCGPADCERLDERDVEERADGSFFIAPGDLVERRDTKPSPDGHWWRCTMHVNGLKVTRRGCFWRPVRDAATILKPHLDPL